MAATTAKTRSRKRPVTYSRVFAVLVSLVFSLSLCAGTLLLLEGRPIAGVSRYNLLAASKNINLADLTLRHLTPPVRARRWKYIVIYQSHSSAGDAAELARGRLLEDTHGSGDRVLQEVPADFHFVIDNGRNNVGKADGTVEIGKPWLRQAFSAPYCQWPDPRYHHYTVYKQAIGICLIGNVNVKPFTRNQVAALRQLVRQLQRKYNVPDSRVKFQWDIAKDSTSQEASISSQFDGLLGR